MRIAELSRESGVPAPTIKYYVREGLLEPGEPINRNQVRYGDAHLRRLKLVRALVEVGGLSIASIGRLLAAVDSPATTVHEALGKAQYATTPTYEYKAGAAAREAAAEQVAELISRRGWRVKPESPARDLMVSALAALRELDQEDLLALADAYAAPAEQIAATNIAITLRRSTIDDRLESVVIGSVLGDTLFAAMRRLAEESASTSLTPEAEPSPEE